MKKTLLAEIENYRRLSFYNTKLTLTENVELISEQFENAAVTLRDVQSAFGDGFDSALRDLKLVGIDAARLTELLEKDAKSFESEFNQALGKDIESGYKQGVLGPQGKAISKIEYLRRVTNRTKAKGAKLTPEELVDIRKEVISDNKLKAAQFTGDLSQGGKNASQGGKDMGGGLKDVTGTKIDGEYIDYEEIKDIEKNKKPTDEKDAKDIEKSNPEVKGQKWAWLKKWGLRLGIGLPILWLIFLRGKGKDAPPIVTGGDDNDGKHGGGGDGGGGGGEATNYTPCQPNNYVRGCKSNVISQVQSCLNQRKTDNLNDLQTDGKFGPLTQAKLRTNFPELANGFKDADIAKICGNTPSTTPTTDISNYSSVEGDDGYVPTPFDTEQ
jgi:hypothetical protein